MATQKDARLYGMTKRAFKETRGRKPLPAKLRRDRRVVIRMTKGEYESLEEMARGTAETLSEFVRRASLCGV